MTKRVVFSGGIQVKALAKAYRLDVALDHDEDVFFIGAESVTREAAHKVIAAADILVTDLTAAGPTVPDELVRVGTLRIAVPVVTADFIWPFAAGAHPRNAYTPGLPDGPFPAGFGDSYLDRLAEEGLAEDDAIARYLALDVAHEAGLDARLEATLDGLRALDKQTGFDLAAFVSENFRTQWLFATRDRPNMPLFRHIAGRLFGQMGVSAARVAQISETFLPPGAMPIHPGVLAHFGMEVPSPAQLYPVLDEGFFSFEDYCRRYWTYSFNRLLHAAIAKAESNPSEAIPELRLALETSPDSRSGLRALRDAERQVSDESMLAPLALFAPSEPSSPAAGPAAPAAPTESTTPAPAPAVASGSEAVVPPDLVQAALRTTSPAWIEPAAPADAAAEPGAGQDAFLPRAAFGSALVRVPPRPGGPTIDAEAPPDSANLPSLRFTGFPLPEGSDAPRIDSIPMPLTEFGDIATSSSPLVIAPPDDVPAPQPQPYIELTMEEIGDSMAPMLPAAKSPSGRGANYSPLAPAEHLIPLLPRLLPNTRGMAGAADRPFTDMPETMPPPPLRPVLPPELHPEPVKTSLMSKIMEQLRK